MKIMHKDHSFNPEILRAYDIRGTVGVTLFNEDAYYLGRSLAKVLEEKGLKGKVCIGCDGRLTSPELHSLLVKGLIDSGVDVLDIGLVPTPALYFATITEKCIAGVMITGSHNPPEYNGFKIMLNGSSFFGEDIQKLADVVKAGNFPYGIGSVSALDIKPVYLNYLIQHVANNLNDKLKIAWDPGNGATGEIISMLIKQLPGQHYLINEVIDGTFPAHHPDPTVHENLVQLIDLVKKNKCDLGIAFDGDGDRIGIVDSNGQAVHGDQILFILAKDLLSRHPGAKIIADVKTSDIIFDQIAQMGGVPVMWRTGHSFIKTKMKEENALLAGEMSGHIFFAEDYYNFDDAIFGACKIIKFLSKSTNSIAQIIASLPKAYGTTELKIEVAESEKFAIVEKLKQLLKKLNKTFNDLDGVRVKEEGGWWLLRASNTQSILIVRIEAQSLEKLSQISNALVGYCEAIGLSTVEIENAIKHIV